MEQTIILIAEDDPDDRYLLESAFKEQGYTEKLQFVENGIEVVTYLQKANASKESGKDIPRIILLDLNMPKKDGREVLRELKQNDVFKKIPIVIFTTTKNENEIRRCYELGANTYIVKPVTFEELLNTIDHIMKYWLNTASVAS